MIHSYSIQILGLIEANMKHLETITVFCVHILISVTQHYNPGDIFIKKYQHVATKEGCTECLKTSSKLVEPDAPVNAKMSVGITNAVCMKNWKLDSTEDSMTIDMTTIWS